MDRLRNIVANRGFTFEDLKNPILKRVNRADRLLILKIFIHNNQIGTDALSFHLDSEI